MSDIPTTYAFVLDGQGIPTSTSPQTIHTALQDARTPLGAAVLLSCYQAFVQDFSSLTELERAESGLTLDECPEPEALLNLPQRLPCNAVIGNIHLYLVQLLRYIANTDASVLRETHSTFGVLGFSTGMIASAVIACADNIPRFVTHATEAFRLAFWIGLRAQQYASRSLLDIKMSGAATQSWTLVTFGSSRAELQDAVDRFSAEQVRHHCIFSRIGY